MKTGIFQARICDKLPVFHSLITKDLRKGLRKHDLDEERSAEISAHLNLARKSLVNLTKAIISNALLQPIIDPSIDPITAEHHSTNYYHVSLLAIISFRACACDKIVMFSMLCLTDAAFFHSRKKVCGRLDEERLPNFGRLTESVPGNVYSCG